ncbi:DUF6221 family protein [Promicromonospora umidemergens]|nr:DUF6221 family protein [Promicromonospora umidemergens]
MTLIEFLEARIAEDEAAAQAVEQSAPSDPELRAAHQDQLGHSDAELTAWWKRRETALHPTGTWMVGVSPRRALAECEAKRAIIGMHDAELDLPEQRRAGLEDGLRIAVRALALTYANHPDYDEEWRP